MELRKFSLNFECIFECSIFICMTSKLREIDLVRKLTFLKWYPIEKSFQKKIHAMFLSLFLIHYKGKISFNHQKEKISILRRDQRIDNDSVTKKVQTIGMKFLTSESKDCGQTENTVLCTLDGNTLTISGDGPMKDLDPIESLFTPKYNILTIIVESGVTRIGNYAFNGYYLATSATISNTVVSIGNYAFSDCSGLITLDIPNSVETIDHDAFSNCQKLTQITLGTGVQTIDYSVFDYCIELT